MSVANPAVRIPRRSVEQPAGEVGMWAKMFDPPNESPPTPDRVAPTNPVPEVMEAAGLVDNVDTPRTWTTDLMHGDTLPTWDNRPNGLLYYLIRHEDNDEADGTFPGPTIRVPRGAVFHSEVQGHGPPPHTIHWHGYEPSAMNDGVGHCSMEVGRYTYQFQPNHMGLYFYHCHRNTVQHFEFGLYGAMVTMAPDTFFSSLNANGTLNNNPIGACRDGVFRVAANLAGTPLANLPGANTQPLEAPDPLGQFPTHPHAQTVPYDVEALWVPDDRDSLWSDIARDARAYFPRQGNEPGVDDRWERGLFNQFNSDYFFVTGVPVVPLDGVKRIGNTGSIPGGVEIPAALNGGIGFGNSPATQVSVNARVNQTVLIRVIDAAYNNIKVTFPADVVIIAFDGRALGVPPFGSYNAPFVLPAGTPILLSVARRIDCLMRRTTPLDSFATVEFIEGNSRSATRAELGQVRQIARIPIQITA